MEGFATVEEALEELRNGKLILVTDDEDRENEGDFICAAEFATMENINFMAMHGKGLICMPMSAEYVKKLHFPQMVENNTDNHETAFTVSVDYVETTTGISAAERSMTAMRCVAEDAKPEDFRRPGHMFPLLAKKNGVLERNGHTEATVDLCRLAGLKECGLCCEIMREDGTMMRTTELLNIAGIAAQHQGRKPVLQRNGAIAIVPVFQPLATLAGSQIDALNHIQLIKVPDRRQRRHGLLRKKVKNIADGLIEPPGNQKCQDQRGQENDGGNKVKAFAQDIQLGEHQLIVLDNHQGIFVRLCVDIGDQILLAVDLVFVASALLGEFTALGAELLQQLIVILLNLGEQLLTGDAGVGRHIVGGGGHAVAAAGERPALSGPHCSGHRPPPLSGVFRP